MEGAFACAPCGASYPISRGIPRFAGGPLATDVSTTVEGFGYQWKKANPLVQNTRFTDSALFLDFIQPVEARYFEGKTVLDAGCGLGRFTHWARQFGAAAVVGVDLSESCEAAFENTRALDNVLIVQADLFELPLRPEFDYVFSVGVLHHTSSPQGAFEKVAALVKPGGGLSAWVYGRENNGWIIYGLNPFRSLVTSRLPRWALILLAYAITVPMYLVLKLVYRPVGQFRVLRPLRRVLFYFDYLYYLGQFGLNEQTLVVFDHLVPTIAEYIPRDEFERWFSDNALGDVVLRWRSRNSWAGFGVRAKEPASTLEASSSRKV
jgi:SAM-dependent methyltransferase